MGWIQSRLLECDKAQIEKSVTLLKQVQSHIGLTITMDPSDESSGSLEDYLNEELQRAKLFWL